MGRDRLGGKDTIKRLASARERQRRREKSRASRMYGFATLF